MQSCHQEERDAKAAAAGGRGERRDGEGNQKVGRDQFKVGQKRFERRKLA